MASFIHQDRIAEKLEMARTLGLVTKYFVAPRVDRPAVKVWRSPHASDDGLRKYLARLLDGLVASQQIVVMAPSSPAETGS
jgi:hypothetical protein